MDLDSLRCFEAAATTLNFRAAASRVHLSPTAFSERLRRLEEELGVSLFARGTRRVALTDAGLRILPLSRELLAGSERIAKVAASSSDESSYELYLGTRHELSSSWLCPALNGLERNRPQRQLHLYNGDSADLLWRLERGELDAVIGSMRLTSSRLTYAALHAEEYSFVAQRRCLHNLEGARSLTLVDVSRDLPLFRYFLDALPNAEPWPFARVEHQGGIANIRRRLLDCDDRVAVLPSYFVKEDLAAKRLVRLMPKVKLRSDTFRLVWRTGHPRTTQLLQLAEELRALPLK